MSKLPKSHKKNQKTNFIPDFTTEAFYKGGHVQLSGDGKLLYCCCGSTVKVVETASGVIQRTIGEVGDNNDLTAFALNHDCSVLVTASKNSLFLQWDCKTYTVTRTWKSTHFGPVSRLAFQYGSVLLASGGADGKLKIWDLLKQYCTHKLSGAQGVFSVVQFHPNVGSGHIFGAADDSKIHVWDLKSGQTVTHLEGHFSPVTSIDFTPDCKSMVSSGRDRVVFIWDLVKYTLQKTVPVFEEIESVMWCPVGRKLPDIGVTSEDMHFITAGSKGVLKVWNVRTGTPVYSQDTTQTNEKLHPQITHAAYSAALDSIFTVTFEQNIIFYKLDDLGLFKQLIGNSEEVLDLALFGENESHLAVATNSPFIKIFELATQDCQLLEGHTDLVLSLRKFPDKPLWLASCAKDCSIKIWAMNVDTKLVTCLFTGSGHTQNVTAVACCKIGAQFVVSGSADNTIKLWEIPEKVRLMGTSSFSLASVGTTRAHQKDINSIDVSPNNLLLATGSQDKTAKIWKTDQLELCGTLRGHRKGIWCVEFSQVDQVIATSSADGTIKIWALSDYSCAKTFEGHECSVLKVHFLSRGMQLLTSASDGNIKLWNVKANECVKTFDGHEDKVWAVVLSNNEACFYSGGADAKIVRWKDVTQEEIDEEFKQQESLILEEQVIQNLLKDKKWLKALKKALHLDQPHRALTVCKEILLQKDFHNDLLMTLKGLDMPQVNALLKYCTIWNMNSKHCAAAQAVLNVVLKLWTPEDMLKFPDIAEIVEGLLPYTERHFQRIALLQQQGMFVDYLWNTMKVAGSNS